MPVSRNVYKDIRGCNTPIAGSDPPDVETSGAGWSPAPRQNTLKISANCVIASSTDSRQPQNVDHNKVVQLCAIDLRTCAIAIACDSVRDAMLAYRVAHGFCIESHEAAQVIRLFRDRRTAIREILNLYEGAC